MTKGGKNLTWLGIAAIAIATVATSISLTIYHNSGDIYLDRSRPGFLPDETELETEKPTEDYDFSKINQLNLETIEEYVQHLQNEARAIDAYEKPFDVDALSDKNLGI